MKNLNFKDKWVLVTGASSGLGAEMARQLAVQHGANLILLARRIERLESLKTLIEGETNSKVQVFAIDLSIPEQVEKLLQTVLSEYDLYAAILNAGITYLGKHLALPKEQFNQMIQTNIVSVTYMTSQLAAYFEKKQSVSGIMIVSSMAAIFPTPFQAAYAGTKGFLLNFASALSQELESRALSITVFLPGGIATEMTAGNGFNELRGYLMPVQQVAKEGLVAFKKRRSTYIPGFLNRLSSRLAFLLRKDFIIKQTGKTYKKSLDRHSEL